MNPPTYAQATDSRTRRRLHCVVTIYHEGEILSLRTGAAQPQEIAPQELGAGEALGFLALLAVVTITFVCLVLIAVHYFGAEAGSAAVDL
ncbi:unnamed protein product [Sympodiomycopsis kandeliae]